MTLGKGVGPSRSVLDDHRKILQAIELIRLGARLPLLQAEIALPYERLSKLYKEVSGGASAKGQLPFSADWFVDRKFNAEASLFYCIYSGLQRFYETEPLERMMKAYQLYRSEISSSSKLSITRAWFLIRLMQTGALVPVSCKQCKGLFVDFPKAQGVIYVCHFCLKQKKGSGKVASYVFPKKSRRLPQ